MENRKVESTHMYLANFHISFCKVGEKVNKFSTLHCGSPTSDDNNEPFQSETLISPIQLNNTDFELKTFIDDV
ncbi:CLUMA_CG021103, isoform A [Clunio marinus]|uniref:CLUMA_CG021103, isoform A n=1 Tax=Clunio marinus TaxID=568069 RepID=A0A1J1J648_9DIPT|nr:CLUMA_CG021103, isoform A [Clunio marinus]